MTYLGAILYPLSGWILFAFWREVRGRSFEDLLERSLGAHRHVHRALARHPRGGTWKQHLRWMREAW
jgi:hypothetical protein